MPQAENRSRCRERIGNKSKYVRVASCHSQLLDSWRYGGYRLHHVSSPLHGTTCESLFLFPFFERVRPQFLLPHYQMLRRILGELLLITQDEQVCRVCTGPGLTDLRWPLRGSYGAECIGFTKMQ